MDIDINTLVNAVCVIWGTIALRGSIVGLTKRISAVENTQIADKVVLLDHQGRIIKLEAA